MPHSVPSGEKALRRGDLGECIFTLGCLVWGRFGHNPKQLGPGCGAAESVVVRCPGWGGPGRRRHLLLRSGLGRSTLPEASVLLGGGWEGAEAWCRGPPAAADLINMCAQRFLMAFSPNPAMMIGFIPGPAHVHGDHELRRLLPRPGLLILG